MKTKALALLLICILLLAGCGKRKPDDFRKTNWGDSKSAVTRSEGKDFLFATDELLVFDVAVQTYNAEVYYDFADDHLIVAQLKLLAEGKYTIAELIAAYEVYAAELTELYGPPLNADPVVWLDDDPAYQGDGHNVSIYNQRMEYFLEWQTETTRTTLLLNYKDAQINFIHMAVPIEAPAN